ncbi:ATP-dependent sacrificial sulfur transferase LarE [Bengtsoniella intestinalis]|uniref:ATP-dependent sacrificial sulfur transferase LarE n=1 Tax=Bengtsoniella intestinalis TaxID=3073143 RepID=UPI00391FA7E9
MDALRRTLHTMVAEGACIAFSGGVDSSILLQISCQEGKKLGKPVYAVTFETKLHPCADLAIAQSVAQETGAIHHVIAVNELDNPAMLQNPIDRCYQCKKYLFATLVDFAKQHHLPHIIDGTNADDLTVYRPGIKALRELGIVSPLAELGISKAQVRDLASAMGLSVSNRPSAPCLATRLPYNTPIDFDTLHQIDLGETYLKDMGFAVCRIRLHGDIARIEIPKADFPQFLAKQEPIVLHLKHLGFPYVTLDLEGFRSGSMDIHLTR